MVDDYLDSRMSRLDLLALCGQRLWQAFLFPPAGIFYKAGFVSSTNGGIFSI